jgi:hypothetical protein
MKVINSGNIEKWMFDYFEGNLSLHERLEVEHFIKENPSYQADFDAWSGAFVKEEPFLYKNTDVLVKKGFFEDKKMLVLFFVLLGSGVIIHYLTNNEKEVNNNSSLLLVENSNTVKKTSVFPSVNIQKAKNDINEFVNLMNDGEVLSSKELLNNHNKISSNGVLSVGYINTSDESILVKNQEDKHSIEILDQVKTREVINNNLTKDLISHENNRSVFPLIAYSEKSIDFLIESNLKNYATKDKYNLVVHKDAKKGIVEYKKKKNTFNHYKSKTLSQSLNKMLNKELSLTVYDNRLMMKQNQMTLGINTAFAGKIKASRVQANYEKLSLFNKNDFMVSYDTKIKGLNAGVGMLLSNQIDDTFDKKQVDLFYAHSFNVGGLKVIPSIKGGIRQTKVNWNNIGVSSLSESLQDSINKNTSLSFNMSPSLMVELPFAYAGVQVNEAYNSGDKFVKDFKSLESTNTRNYSLVFGTDYRKSFGKRFIMSPQLYIDIYEDNRKTKYTFATTMQYNKGLLGVGYTNNKTFRGVVGFDIGEFRMTYNAEADLDLYKSGGLNSLKHEVAVQFIISKKKTGILLYD